MGYKTTTGTNYYRVCSCKIVHHSSRLLNSKSDCHERIFCNFVSCYHLTPQYNSKVHCKSQINPLFKPKKVNVLKKEDEK